MRYVFCWHKANIVFARLSLFRKRARDRAPKCLILLSGPRLETRCFSKHYEVSFSPKQERRGHEGVWWINTFPAWTLRRAASRNGHPPHRFADQRQLANATVLRLERRKVVSELQSMSALPPIADMRRARSNSPLSANNGHRRLVLVPAREPMVPLSPWQADCSRRGKDTAFSERAAWLCTPTPVAG